MPADYHANRSPECSPPARSNYLLMEGLVTMAIPMGLGVSGHHLNNPYMVADRKFDGVLINRASYADKTRPAEEPVQTQK